MAFVLHLLSRDDLEAFEKGFGLASAVRLDDADDDVAPFAAPRKILSLPRVSCFAAASNASGEGLPSRSAIATI